MTNEEITKAINNCQYRHIGMGDKYAICSLCCEPCIAAVNGGRCRILMELFAESEEEKKNE